MSAFPLSAVRQPTLFASATMAAPASYAELIAGLRAAARSGGSSGIARFLTGNAEATQGLMSTKEGRIAATVVIVSFVGGYEAGRAWPQVQATVAALQAIYAGSGSAQRKANDAVNVITQSLGSVPTGQSSNANNHTAAGRRVQSLQTSIQETSADLAETVGIRARSSHADDSLDGIINAKMKKLEALVLQLPRAGVTSAPVSTTMSPVPDSASPLPISTPATNYKPLPADTAPPGPTVAQQQADQRRHAQIIEQREQAAFMVRLNEQATGSRTANVATVKDMVRSMPLAELKEQVGALKKFIAHPSGSNVYEHTDVAGKKPPQASNADYIQAQVGGFGLITVADAEAMSKSLSAYIAKVERSLAAAKPSVASGAGVNATKDSDDAVGAPISQADHAILSDARGYIAGLLPQYANAPPGSDAATDRGRIQGLLTAVDQALATNRMPIGGGTGGGNQALNRLLNALRQYFVHQPSPPPPPGRPDWGKIMTVAVGLLAGATWIVRGRVTHDLGDRLTPGLDLNFKPFDLDSRLRDPKKLMDPAEVSKLRAEILTHYLGQAETKMAVANQGAGDTVSKVAREQIVLDGLSLARSLANPRTLDTSYTPEATVINTLSNLRSLGDTRAAQTLSQALSLANADIGRLNSNVADTWTLNTQTTPLQKSTTPEESLNAALGRVGLTSKQLTQVSKSSSTTDVAVTQAKVEAALISLRSRQKVLEAETKGIEQTYGTTTGRDGAVGALDRLRTGLNEFTKSLSTRNADPQAQETIKLTQGRADDAAGRVPNLVANLLNTKKQEATGITGTIVSLQVSATNLNFVKASLANAEKTTAVAAAVNQTIAPLESQRANAQARLVQAQTELSTLGPQLQSRQTRLGDLTRRIDKYEVAHASAETAARAAVPLPNNTALQLSGQVDTTNGRLVVSAADAQTLIGEFARFKGLYLNGGLTAQQLKLVESAVNRFVDPATRERKPLIPYPFVSQQGSTPVDGALLTPHLYEQAKAERNQLLAQVNSQDGKAGEIGQRVNGITAEISILDARIQEARRAIDVLYGAKATTPALPAPEAAAPR